MIPCSSNEIRYNQREDAMTPCEPHDSCGGFACLGFWVGPPAAFYKYIAQAVDLHGFGSKPVVMSYSGHTSFVGPEGLAVPIALMGLHALSLAAFACKTRGNHSHMNRSFQLGSQMPSSPTRIPGKPLLFNILIEGKRRPPS